MIVFEEKFAEKLSLTTNKFCREILFFLAVSPRNRQFTVCLFVPEERNMFVFFFYADCKNICYKSVGMMSSLFYDTFR